LAPAYDDLILDHIKNARNFRVLERVSHQTRGSNPMCGDDLVLYLETDGNRIVDIGFQCTCCGLSMASASVMTDAVKGRPLAEARRLLLEFRERLDGTGHADSTALTPEQQALLDARRRFPARARCLALAWNTLLTTLPETG
jgi:nitrogen fixation protein NifU and related proteins